FGAEVVICPTNVAPDDPKSYYSVSRRLTEETPGAFNPNQYANQANPEAHYRSTGPEIWDQVGDDLDVLVLGVGTGGAGTGAGRRAWRSTPRSWWRGSSTRIRRSSRSFPTAGAPTSRSSSTTTGCSTTGCWRGRRPRSRSCSTPSTSRSRTSRP